VLGGRVETSGEAISHEFEYLIYSCEIASSSYATPRNDSNLLVVADSLEAAQHPDYLFRFRVPGD
jgi:hypothetical protein